MEYNSLYNILIWSNFGLFSGYKNTKTIFTVVLRLLNPIVYDIEKCLSAHII